MALRQVKPKRRPQQRERQAARDVQGHFVDPIGVGRAGHVERQVRGQEGDERGALLADDSVLARAFAAELTDLLLDNGSGRPDATTLRHTVASIAAVASDRPWLARAMLERIAARQRLNAKEPVQLVAGSEPTGWFAMLDANHRDLELASAVDRQLFWPGREDVSFVPPKLAKSAAMSSLAEPAPELTALTAAVAMMLAPVILAVVAIPDSTLPLKLNPVAFKLPAITLHVALSVAPCTMLAVSMLPPDTLPTACTLPVTVINPAVLILPPVTLPVAVTKPPVLMLAPVMLPAPVTVPLALTEAALNAPAVMMLPPVTLPVAVINPAVTMLPPTIFPVTVALPPVLMFAPVTLPATLSAVPDVLEIATTVAVLNVTVPAAVVAVAGPMSINVVDPAKPFSPI